MKLPCADPFERGFLTDQRRLRDDSGINKNLISGSRTYTDVPLLDFIFFQSCFSVVVQIWFG